MGLKINKKTYKLDEPQFINEVTNKKRIILDNSFTSNMAYVNGWKTRLGGEYKRTSAFSIDRDGTVYQHFDPKFYSEIFDNDEFNRESIGITLVNEGWLLKRDKSYYNLRNQEYYGDVFEKYWRGYDFWSTYEDVQYESLKKLIIELTNNFDIYNKMVKHNTKLLNPLDLYGVISKSNFNVEYTGVSPAFNFNNLVKK